MKILLCIVSILMLFIILTGGCHSGSVPQSSSPKEDSYRFRIGNGIERQVVLPEREFEKYYEALKVLSDKERRDREKALTLFDELAKEYIDSPLAPIYVDTVCLLEQMVKEDRVWREPADVSKLSLEEQINYYIHKLRDEPCPDFASAKGWLQIPGEQGISILDQGNASRKLVEIGVIALPALEKLLYDRRLIREGYPRRFGGLQTGSRWIWVRDVLGFGAAREGVIHRTIQGLPTEFYRYKDAAEEIIEAIKSKDKKTKEKSEEKK